jgi:hypothetical protein
MDKQSSELSTGAKFGYFCLGCFLPLVGHTIIWAVNKDQSTLSDAVKFGIIGTWSLLLMAIAATMLLTIMGITLYLAW